MNNIKKSNQQLEGYIKAKNMPLPYPADTRQPQEDYKMFKRS